MQAGRFAVAGGVAAVIDLAITWTLQVGLEIAGGYWARTIGWVIGTVLAYLINRRWTFGAPASKRRFGATMVTYALTYGVNIAIYRILFPWLDDLVNINIALILAFIGAQAVATTLNFLIQRWLIFRG